MKVVHLISGDLWAGAEVATFELLRAQQSMPGIEASAIVLNPGTLADRLRAARITVTLENETGRSFAELARAVRRRVAEAGVDLVHAHRYKEDLLAALSGRPWVATQHGRPEPFSGADRVRAFITGSLDDVAKRLSAKRVIGVSDEVAEWLGPRVGRSRVRTVPNGIADPTTRIETVQWLERPLRVGFLGRLSPVKRPLLAVECIAHCPGVELEILGDGPLHDAVEARATELGVRDRVRLRGHVDEPLPYVANWRAMLSTSLHEGHPMSVLEAMALATPVFYTASGVADAVGPAAGCAIDSNAAPAVWGASLARFVQSESSKTSESSGPAASEAARSRFIEAFDVGRTAARTVEVYREALGSAG